MRRAAELQFAAGGEGAGALDEAELVRIGEEVGLDARYVRQALAERRAAALVPTMPTERALPTRLWGSAVVRESRVAPGARDEVLRKVEVFFRERESLRQVRDRPGRSLWEPASDLWSHLQRGLDFGGRGYNLAKAKGVALSVEQLEPGRSLVTLTVDLRNQRAEHAAGWLLGLALPAGILSAAGLVLGAEAPVFLAAPLAGAATLGAGSWAAARTFRRRRERVRLALQGLLDRLEQGLPLETPRRSFWERLSLDL